MVSCEVFVCASALHSDSTYATVSCSLPHILHLTPASCSFWSFLCRCWYNSWIPATVCVGAVFHSDIQAKQSLSRFSSFPRFAISFPCHLSSSISSFRLLCTAFLAILRSSAFPPPHLLWCGQLVVAVVYPASFLALQHIFTRLSQGIAVWYRLFSLQTLGQVPLLSLDLHTNAQQP